MLTASIITITQYKRRNFIKNLCNLVRDQDYSNIIEWVIVEGSKSVNEKILNKKEIDILIEYNKDIKIRYIYPSLIWNIGSLRNIGNRSCKGDIIVCMDDDDYYPKDRVSHCVERLIDTGLEIAGCSNMYMYDYNYEKLYKFDKFENHSTNNCMAFKRDYLKHHRHDIDISYGEESSFTNNFTIEMAELDPKKCIIASSHMTNTFDKKKLIKKMDNDEIYNLFEINKDIRYFIPNYIYLNMKKIILGNDYIHN